MLIRRLKPPRRLTLYSVHSVEGGMGRSRHALRTALTAASEGRTILIETDFAGTSVIDEDIFEAPKWDRKVTSKLLEADLPLGFCTVTETAQRVRDRASCLRQLSEDDDRFLPFLNDFVLHVPSVRDQQHDVNPLNLLWRSTLKQNLHLIPASPLPGDVERMQPLINDDAHSAFIESRLEILLQLLTASGDVTVVFDTPRGFHGIAKAILSLCIRNSARPQEPLAQDGYRPLQHIEDVTWKGFVLSRGQNDVTTQRWLDVFKPDERKHIEVLAE